MIMKRWGYKPSNGNHHLPCEEPISSSDELDVPLHRSKQQQQQPPPQQPQPLPEFGAPHQPLRFRVRSYPDVRQTGHNGGGTSLLSLSSRHSPNFLLPVHEDDVPNDGDALSPPVILTNSPVTAPKATWENQYGYFLKQNKSSPQPPPTTTTRSFSSVLVKGTTTGPLLPPPETLSTRSSSLGSSTAMSTPLGASPSDMLTAGSPKQQQQQQHAVGETVDERSVRGGKLFSGLMFRNSAGSSSNNDHEQQQQQQRLRRNQRSSFSSAASDELDETKRRGVEKAYSPGNPRFRKEHRMSLDGINNNNVPRFPLLIPPQQVLLQQLQHQQQQQDDALETMAGVVIAVDTVKTTTPRSPKSSFMKKMFTDFHNSAANTEVPYLGDEMSIHNARSVLWSSKGRGNGGGSSSNNDCITALSGSNSGSILRPVRGVETWLKGRRYLLGPAIYASCHPKTLLHLQAPVVSLADYAKHKASSHAAMDICLGDCWLSSAVVNDTKNSSSSSDWTQSHLIVRQNYLLDFASADCTACGPRGMLHLAFAVAWPHEHFADTIYLSCYGSPCAKADPKRLLLRISSNSSSRGAPDERGVVRQQVVDCLNRAANLTLNDVYEMSNDKESSLGESQYVKVRAVCKRNSDDGAATNSHRAIKIFDKSKFWRAVVKGQERADTIVREISVQATLSAQCAAAAASTTTKNDAPIVRIYGFFETATEMVIELERLEGTDLFQYVSSKNVLSEAEAARILKDVLTALDTMRSLGLAHRDIKPANILMSSSSSSSTKGEDADEHAVVGVKVGDFGMSTFVDVDGLVRGRCGTPGYVAPEIFQTGAYGGYGNKVDVFSAGVTLYVCLCGYEPFYGETDQELKEANRRAVVDFPPDEWRHISPAAIDLIQQMMQVDPTRRPSAREALAHDFFNQAAAAASF